MPIEKEEQEEAKYSYTTYRPPEHRVNIDETSDHKFSYIKRKNTLIPKAKPSYRARCTCNGWKHTNGFTTLQAARRQWESHMAEVQKQPTLF